MRLLTFIAVLVCFNSLAQCDTQISTYHPDSVRLLSEINFECDTIAFRQPNVMVLSKHEGYNDPMYLCTYYDSLWHLVQLKEWTGYIPKAEIQLLKIEGIPDPCVYIRWKDGDWGSGMGSHQWGKAIWSFSLRKCYLDIIDKSYYFINDKYGPDATYKRIWFRHKCAIALNSKGLEVLSNNTCENKFANWESGEQVSYDEVVKLRKGFYAFKDGKWKYSSTGW